MKLRHFPKKKPMLLAIRVTKEVPNVTDESEHFQPLINNALNKGNFISFDHGIHKCWYLLTQIEYE
jgi:hypothetical protein